MCPLIRIHCSLSWTLCLCVICIFYLALYSFIHLSISLNLIFHLCSKDSILLVNRSLLFFLWSDVPFLFVKYELSTDKNSDQCSDQLTSRSPFPLFPNFLSLFSYLFLCHWQPVSHSLHYFLFVCFLVKVWKTAVRFFCAWNECCQMQGLG